MNEHSSAKQGRKDRSVDSAEAKLRDLAATPASPSSCLLPSAGLVTSTATMLPDFVQPHPLDLLVQPSRPSDCVTWRSLIKDAVRLDGMEPMPESRAIATTEDECLATTIEQIQEALQCIHLPEIGTKVALTIVPATIMHLYRLTSAVLQTFMTTSAAQTTTPSPAELAASASEWETTQHAASNFSWYETPANFSTTLEPGTILKLEYATDLTNYTVPGSLSMSRIIYTTLDVHGSLLPASAYILWPYHALPADETYNVALWAHGASGIFQPCAPSNYRSLQYHFMVPYQLANQGMAVVAPDYAGLGVGSFANGSGTRIRHPFIVPAAQANDMAYALTAARAVFPQYLAPDGPFVAIGHSQGGTATWGFIEQQAVSPVSGYRGAVIIAPGINPVHVLQDAKQYPDAAWSTPAQSLLLPLTIDAVTTTYPSYNWAGFTKVAADIFHHAYQRFQGCFPTQNVVFGSLPVNQLAIQDWANAPEVQAWQNLTRVGNKRFAGPVLLIAGNKNGSDGVFPYDPPIRSSILSAVNHLCDLMKQGAWSQSLQVVGFDAATHFGVIQASQNLWLEWVKQRLGGPSSSPPTGCRVSNVSAFRGGADTVQSIGANWLVEWVNATYQWQYSL